MFQLAFNGIGRWIIVREGSDPRYFDFSPRYSWTTEAAAKAECERINIEYGFINA